MQAFILEVNGVFCMFSIEETPSNDRFGSQWLTFWHATDNIVYWNHSALVGTDASTNDHYCQQFLHKRRPNEWNNGPECILPCSCSFSLDASGRLYAHVSETSRPSPAGGGGHKKGHTNNFHKENDPSEFNILQLLSYSVSCIISTLPLLPCFVKETPKQDI